MRNFIFYTGAFIMLLNVSCVSMKPRMDTDSFLEYKMNRSKVVGLQAAVIKNGDLLYTKSVGKLRSDSLGKINDSTLFMIASTSKPITALTVLSLVSQNKLALDDAVNNYLPFKVENPYYPNNEITVRMLLTHTSTIKDNWAILDSLYTLPEGGDSPLELKDYLKDYLSVEGKYYDDQLNFQNEKPSTYWEYANTGYALLGLIVEEVSKKPFNTYCREAIFNPLEMEDTFWFLKEIPHQNITNPHEITENGHEVLNHYGYPTYPDGQIRTTVTDYTKFLQLIMHDGKFNGKQLIKEELINEFLKIQYPKTNKWQAISWNYNEFENFIFYLNLPHLPAHTGGDPGIATAVFFDKEKKGAVLLFLNTRLNNFRGVKSMYLDVLKRLAKDASIK